MLGSPVPQRRMHWLPVVRVVEYLAMPPRLRIVEAPCHNGVPCIAPCHNRASRHRRGSIIGAVGVKPARSGQPLVGCLRRWFSAMASRHHRRQALELFLRRLATGRVPCDPAPIPPMAGGQMRQ